MRKSVFLFIIIFLAVVYAGAKNQPDYSHLIFPNPGEKICLVRSDNNKLKMLSGKKVVQDTPLIRNIKKELNYPFHQSVIKLNQCSRNFSANTEGPNVLFLSQNEGGFPRRGLILTKEGKTGEYPKLNYVDLVIDDERLAKGQMYIFSHELGHVMMNNIWDNLGETAAGWLSPKQHVSMGITDYYVSFYEGWGEHFEIFANDNEFYRETFKQSFAYDKITAALWHSNIDRELRVNAVLQNNYIYQKLLPAGVDMKQLSLEKLILLAHTSPIFDKTRLKNAQQMLSCEGVIATIFYKINSNKKLQNNYADKAFYENFLLSPIPAGTKPQDIFTPFENVILKNFRVWQQLKLKGKQLEDGVLFIEFIREWCRSFPGDRDEILKLFTAVTAGKTVSNEPGNIYREMAFLGLIGDYYKYREIRDRYQASLKDLVNKVLKNESKLDANIGPELWIKNKDFLIRSVLWSAKRKKPLSINLNTASAYEIATFPGMSLEKAKDFIRQREKLGYFKSLEEVKKYGFKFD